MIALFPRRALSALLCACTVLLASCRRESSSVAPVPRAPLAAPSDALSIEVEALTGAHTRAVWSHHLGTGSPDPFCSGSSHQLHGLDTRDGQGVRVILAKKNTYSRPLLSPDGGTILFTRKVITRPKEGDATKTFDLTVMATDWQGAEPRALAPGYALDMWQAPGGGPVWVYAARDVPPTHRISWAANKLVRFRLDDPSVEEVVWDQTQISPDNTQLSADGKRASGQTPWPHGGQYLLSPEGTGFLPTITGCWAAMAPDNSYLSWMLDGNHRMATLFTAAPERKTWPLRFNEIAGLEKGEIYHPRWTNHARFITLTGPYIAERGGEEGSIISKGGRSAEVVIAKLNDTATGFEGSVTLTQNDSTDAYPDVWIAGGDKAVLAAFPQGLSAAEVAHDWPAEEGKLAFLWEALGQPNQIRLPDGKSLECHVEAEGAALFGRRMDMQLATGAFKPAALVQSHLVKTMAKDESWTLQAALLPPVVEPSEAGLNGALLELPGWRIELVDGNIALYGIALNHPPLSLPAHLAIRRDHGNLTVFINGDALAPLPLTPLSYVTEAKFGGGMLAAGLQGISLHLIPLSDEAIKAGHQYWKQRIAKALEHNPPRVRLRGKLVESTGVPTAESIDPYTRAMIACVYEVEEVLEGSYEEKQILVCHWALMDRRPVAGLPRKVGDSYELEVEPLDLEKHHPELEGQRVLDDTTAFDLEKWYDIAPPSF